MTLTPAEPQSAPRYSWAEVWTAVLTRPSVQTFQEILSDPGISIRRAYTWMGAVALITFVFVAASLLTLSPTELAAAMPEDVTMSTGQLRSGILINLTCLLPILLLLVLGFFRLMVWTVQFMAKTLGGSVKTDTSLKMIYGFASIQAPLNILSIILLVLPVGILAQILSLIVIIYQFALMSLAVRATYGLPLGRAVAAVLTPYLVMLIIVQLILLPVMM